MYSGWHLVRTPVYYRKNLHVQEFEKKKPRMSENVFRLFSTQGGFPRQIRLFLLLYPIFFSL